MAAANVTWGEERIANELKLKLGIRVSPRTVGKYLRSGRPVRTPDPKQRWLSFVRNHAHVIVACDFFVVVTATFRMLYVFVIMDLDARNSPSQHDRSPHSGMDSATVPRLGQPRVSIRHSRPGHIYSRDLNNEICAMECACREHQCVHRRRIRCASMSAGHYAANVWAFSFHSMSSISRPF
jgi:hypothetical protein